MANGRHETDRHQDILFPFFERDIPLNDRNDIGLIQNITKILFRNLHETQAPFTGDHAVYENKQRAGGRIRLFDQ